MIWYYAPVWFTGRVLNFIDFLGSRILFTPIQKVHATSSDVTQLTALAHAPTITLCTQLGAKESCWARPTKSFLCVNNFTTCFTKNFDFATWNQIFQSKVILSIVQKMKSSLATTMPSEMASGTCASPASSPQIWRWGLIHLSTSQWLAISSVVGGTCTRAVAVTAMTNLWQCSSWSQTRKIWVSRSTKPGSASTDRLTASISASSTLNRIPWEMNTLARLEIFPSLFSFNESSDAWASPDGLRAQIHLFLSNTHLLS